MSAEREQLERASRVTRLKHIYRQGVVTNVLNPMVALFSLSFLPQFVDASAGSVTLQTLVPGVIFNVNGTLIVILIALLAGQWLATRIAFWKWQERFTLTVRAGCARCQTGFGRPVRRYSGRAIARYTNGRPDAFDPEEARLRA